MTDADRGPAPKVVDSPRIAEMRSEISRISTALSVGLSTHVSREEIKSWVWLDSTTVKPYGMDYDAYEHRHVQSVVRAEGAEASCALSSSERCNSLSVSIIVRRNGEYDGALSLNDARSIAELAQEDVPVIHAALPALVRLMHTHFPAACRTM